MKLSGSRAETFCSRADASMRGALIYGADSTLVALRRSMLVDASTDGDALRLTRLDPGRAARDASEVDAALRARGFFSGRPVVLIEGTGDALARPLAEVLREITPEDAFLVATAGVLPARSTLRKLFETGEGLVAIACHGGPPAPGELEGLLARAGLAKALTADAMGEMTASAEGMHRGALMQLIEKVSVYALERPAPLDAVELRTVLPATEETQLDRLIAAVAEGRADSVGPLMTRVSASGTTPVAALIAAGRHFRLLLGLATASDGARAAVARLRPPVFGPRRDAMLAQVRSWDLARLEAAVRIIFQTDRHLRSRGTRPDRALVERCLIRIAMIAARA